LNGAQVLFVARLSSAPFDGCDQSGGFAAYEGTSALGYLDIEGESGAEDVGAKQAGRARFGDCVLNMLACLGILVPDIDVALGCTDGVGTVSFPQSR